MLKLEYEYNDRDLPTLLTESDEAGEFAEVAFTYDDRGRLIAESRMVSSGPSPEYDLAYEYDQAGNRTMKIDALNEIETSYVYDVDDGSVFRSDNNRLMLYETWDISGESSALVSTTWTVYGDDAIEHDEREGNPSWIITELESSPGEYTATHFVYDLANRVWLMVGETWQADDEDEDECPELYDIVWAREFRYDAARARYLNRELDPQELKEGQLVTLTETWTDYDGDSSYGDYTVEAGSPPTITDLRSYEPDVSLKDPFDQSSGISYAHGDLIGTTRGTTDSTGAPAIGASGSPVTYTAFGERLDSEGYLRYAYAGAWGYQSHDFPSGENVAPIAFMHVGWRYYDPGTGRFMQRDPMGILGGFNAYGYVDAMPMIRIDPHGLQDATDNENCQDACDLWYESIGIVSCGVKASLENCYNSCDNGYWPRFPRGPGAPRRAKRRPSSMKPWPGPCPPCDTGVPSPGGGTPPTTPVPPPTNLPVNPPVCGATGLETSPLLLALCWRKRKRRA